MGSDSLQSSPVSQRGAAARQAVPAAVPEARQVPMAAPGVVATQLPPVAQTVVVLLGSQAPPAATTVRQTPDAEQASMPSQRGSVARQAVPASVWRSAGAWPS